MEMEKIKSEFISFLKFIYFNLNHDLNKKNFFNFKKYIFSFLKGLTETIPINLKILLIYDKFLFDFIINNFSQLKTTLKKCVIQFILNITGKNISFFLNTFKNLNLGFFDLPLSYNIKYTTIKILGKLVSINSIIISKSDTFASFSKLICKCLSCFNERKINLTKMYLKEKLYCFNKVLIYTRNHWLLLFNKNYCYVYQLFVVKIQSRLNKLTICRSRKQIIFKKYFFIILKNDLCNNLNVATKCIFTGKFVFINRKKNMDIRNFINSLEMNLLVIDQKIRNQGTSNHTVSNNLIEACFVVIKKFESNSYCYDLYKKQFGIKENQKILFMRLKVKIDKDFFYKFILHMFVPFLKGNFFFKKALFLFLMFNQNYNQYNAKINYNLSLCLDTGNTDENSQLLRYIHLLSSKFIYYNLNNFKLVDYKNNIKKIEKIREIKNERYNLNICPIFCIDQISYLKKIDTIFILILIDSQLNYYNKNNYILQNFKILLGCEIKNIKNRFSYMFFQEFFRNSFIYKLDLLLLTNKQEKLEEVKYLVEKYTLGVYSIISFQEIKNLLFSNLFLIHKCNLKITNKAKTNIIYFYKYLKINKNMIKIFQNTSILYSRIKIIELLLRFSLTISKIKFQKNIKNRDVNEAKHIITFHYYNLKYHIKSVILGKNVFSCAEIKNVQNNSKNLKLFQSNILRLLKEELIISTMIIFRMNKIYYKIVNTIMILLTICK
uniref:Uncharacterized protein n=1 Tax=Lotharella vacuolata TaxID=74820 RepID=A0A0H5BH45_9EUKA|nr:hypothetical protein [Lotharella vacuolata]